MPLRPNGDAMTSYRQSFSVPYDARVPPVAPESTINDEFRAQSPAWVTDPTSGLVQLDSKWTTFAPAGGLTGAAIDPRRQMLLLSGSAESVWAGVMQDLPIPSGPTPINYNLLTRMLNASISGPGGDENPDYGGMGWGLLLGEDLRAAPLTSPLWAVGSQLTRATGLIAGDTFTAAFATYAAGLVADGSALLPFTWFRAQVQSSQPSLGVFSTVLNFYVSQDGVSWIHLWSYVDLPVALRQFALAQRCYGDEIEGNGSLLTYGDFVRYFAGPEALQIPLGEALQQGSI